MKDGFSHSGMGRPIPDSENPPPGCRADRRLVLSGLLALAGGLLLPACRQPEPLALAPGQPFPVTRLPDLAGRPVALGGAMKSALLVNFWATWCPPCRREMPSLQRLSARFAPQQLRVVGIAVDDDLNLVREFQLRHHIDFLLLSDAGQKYARDKVGVTVYPMTFLVTRDGVVARAIAGERDWGEEGVLREIEQALDVRRRA